MAERDLLYRAKFQDDVTPAHEEMIARATASAGRMGSAERAWNTEIQQVRASILEQRDALVLRKEALDNPATLKAIRESKQLRDEIKALTGEMKTEPVRSFSQEWQEMASKYFLVTQAAQAFGRGLMAVTDAAKEYDSVRVRLIATEGSAMVADKDLRNLQELAKLPGLGFSQASQAMAALRSLHVSAADTFDLIEGIARGNAAMGGGAEAFSRAMYQITQSIGKSKVDMTDLKPVMEAIPNMGAMIQEKFGSIDSKEINKQLESMGKTSKDFWMDIAEMASKLPPAGDTIANNVDNIGDAWLRLKASMVDPGWIKNATGGLASFVQTLAELNEKYKITQAFLDNGITGVVGALGAAATGQEVGAETSQSQSAQSYADYQIKLQEQRDNKALAAKRKAADGAKEREKLSKQIHDNDISSAKYVTKTGRNEVTLNEGAWGADDSVTEHNRNREKAERTRGQREQTEINERQKLEANAHKIRMDWVGAEAAEKRRAHDEEMRQLTERVETVRSFAATELSQAMQGKLTIKGLEQDLTGFLAEQFAQRTTKWIAEEFIKATTSSSIQAAQTAASVAQAGIVGAAWAAPSLEISMATFGGSAAAGSAAWFNALAAGQVVGGLPMRARGGFAFGDGIFGENGPERGAPLVPMQIVNNTYTTHSRTSGPQHIHFHGADIKTIKRILRNADVDGEDTSR